MTAKKRIENILYDLNKVKSEYGLSKIETNVDVSVEEITEAAAAFGKDVKRFRNDLTCYLKFDNIEINLYAKELDFSCLNPVP